MDANALARQNHLFYYVELPQKCLLVEDFQTFFALAATRAVATKKHPEQHVGSDTLSQMPFRCNNGEFGYLRFENEAARLILEQKINMFKVAIAITRSIGGEHNKKCVMRLQGVEISFEIVSYEGNSDKGFVEITDPVEQCPDDDTPLGRMVEMTVTPVGA